MDPNGNLYASEAPAPKEDTERLMAALRDDFEDTKERLARLAADAQHFADTLEAPE